MILQVFRTNLRGVLFHDVLLCHEKLIIKKS